MFIKKYFKDVLYILISFWLGYLMFLPIQEEPLKLIGGISFILFLVYGIFLINSIGYKISFGLFNTHFILGKSPLQIQLEFLKSMIPYTIRMIIFTLIILIILSIKFQVSVTEIDLKLLKSFLKSILLYLLILYLTTPVFLFLGNKNAMYFYIAIVIILISTDYYLINTGSENVVKFVKQYGITQILNAVLTRTCNIMQLIVFIIIYFGIFILNIELSKRICYIKEQN